ncbi:MAG: cysteine--tRNA ligase [Candidatus Sungiibacteriota bacterium]|uniref:Cysteine--tRNA ligase n=1 Tax=Candidatus Sungiibacteriota bacterium TaxID=2750080 RepID=A0A7T5RJI6_9BACT|nr:MAG: cysteine--tRNA ligase [Candidatus Sungbacteria bacterium]
MIKLYNTLTRKKELFRPLRKEWVGLYTCGPTVYNFAHIGNLRTYIFEDVLRRTIEYAGYKVRHVMNITDVDDKIIRDAKKAKKTIFEFVKPYEKAFFEDLKKLNIEKAWKYPKATKHITEMVRLIASLLKKKLAYQVDGSIYFDISKFKTYGRLSRLSHRELKAGARVDSDEYTKHDVQDFVLWKEKKAGEPSWKAVFSAGGPAFAKATAGRPGWHLECSAMSMKYLGPTFDIHAGGVDLIFPHHENEIAQSEGATGKKFVRFFVEGEHLLVNGEKMSKSLGNVFTLRDIEAKGFNPLVFRYLILTSHYRSKLNFTWESLKAAQNSLEHLQNFVIRLRTERHRGLTSMAGYLRKFGRALADDLDMPEALSVVWDIAHNYNKNPRRYNSKEILTLLYDADRVLGLGLKSLKSEEIPVKILALVKKREEYRKNKEWTKADRVRSRIITWGYTVEDTPMGPLTRRR